LLEFACIILKLPPFEETVGKRCRFIAASHDNNSVTVQLQSARQPHRVNHFVSQVSQQVYTVLAGSAVTEHKTQVSPDAQNLPERVTNLVVS